MVKVLRFVIYEVHQNRILRRLISVDRLVGRLMAILYCCDRSLRNRLLSLVQG